MASYTTSSSSLGGSKRRREAPDDYDPLDRSSRKRERDDEDDGTWTRGAESGRSYRVENRFADDDDDDDHADVRAHTDNLDDEEDIERRPDARFDDEDDDPAPRASSDAPVSTAPALVAVAAPAPSVVPSSMSAEDDVNEMAALQAVMGFSSFTSTKGKHCEDNDKTAARGAVSRVLKRQYRQYMNRKGGFNRPLQQQAPITRK